MTDRPKLVREVMLPVVRSPWRTLALIALWAALPLAILATLTGPAQHPVSDPSAIFWVLR